MHGVGGRGRVGHGFPIPFSGLRKRLGRPGHLVGGGVRGNLEIAQGNRRNGRIPIERIERGEIVGRRIGQTVVEVDSR